MSDEPNYTVGLSLPDGSVVQSAILVVGFFDAEGDTRYGFALRGEAALSSTLGLLELAKAHILRDEGPGS